MIKAVFTTLLLFLSFKTLNASWTTPSQISSIQSDQPNIAVDMKGNAVAVWQVYTGNGFMIQSATCAFKGRWSSPVSLSTPELDADSPKIAVDDHGNAVSIWRLYNPASSIIQASHLSLQKSWSSAINLSKRTGNAESPSLSMSHNQHAVAAWSRYDGKNFMVQSAEFSFNDNWSLPVNQSPSGKDALIPDVAFDKNDEPIIFYATFDGTEFNSRFCKLQNKAIEISNISQSANKGKVASNSQGKVIIVWTEHDGSNYVVQTASIASEGTCSRPSMISNLKFSAYTPLVEIDSTGNAMALWVVSDGSCMALEACFFDQKDGWSNPIKLSRENKSVAFMDVKIDKFGNAVAVWDESDGVHSKVHSAVFRFGTKIWETAECISDEGCFAYQPVLGLNDEGNAVALWLQGVGNSFYVFSSTRLFNR